MSFKPFYVGTCEAKANNDRNIVFEPELENPFEPFLIQDPFGLRKAIVPVFKRDLNGNIFGAGTAFHVGGIGVFLTADHVISFAREPYKSSHDWKEISPVSTGEHPVLLLGMGLIFGRVNIPDEAFAPIEHITMLMQERDDPIAALRGKEELENAVDVAVMKAVFKPDAELPCSVAVRGSGWTPLIGELVLAIGFPKLECKKINESEQRELLLEGMYGAYARITKIHPKGISDLRSAPAFEVEGNWPFGISGGPVFNSLGEVVGVVSRSVLPDEDSPGAGSAVFLSALQDFDKIFPTLDATNPNWQRGWGVLRDEPWELAGFFKTEKEAQKLSEILSSDYEVKYGSNCIGTDNFISVAIF